ncbi:flagellar hook protein FlgE [Rhodoplanes sp. Z2-YC6860]|uniref:flagellar hook protein FlgE n=1 Tax=Rhodoplanes sp. Z2-YC6860 TaxID=674703 RepID=UPI00078E8A72|nr:flagellar hook protein FlgE [Rhodoplanes sp. Z2-YC6860]AMN39091.1 flagellar hook protein FlgE [Rhodoplanes sp. Z2-YC6860]
MGLSGALSSAITGLSAQSQALAMVSDNIANSNTTAYKTNTAMFDDLVTTAVGASQYSSGGVTVSTRANVSQQGLLTTTTNATDLAIQGSGFFIVSDAASGGSVSYTRNGAFTINNAGYLTNNGSYLMGWRTDASGNVVSNSLTAVNTQVATVSGSATTETTFAANLPADAAVGDTFNTSMSVYDGLGTDNTVQVTWTKTAANSWTASFANPTSATDTSTPTGTTSGSVDVTFNADGSLASTNPSPPTISITGWSSGAADSTISLNLGTIGGTDGLTQLASGETPANVSVTGITSDGMAFGKLSSISIGTGGLVNATYSNGQTIAIYKIPLATFANPDGLAAQSNGLYQDTIEAGNPTIQASSTGAAGKIFGSELESSATNTNEEFSSMMAAQQAYSANAQVITAVNKMFDTLISAVSR